MKNIKNMKNIGRGKEGWENPLATWSTWSDSKLHTIPTLTPPLLLGAPLYDVAGACVCICEPLQKILGVTM